MAETIQDLEMIDEHLRTLRGFQRQARDGPARRTLDAVLDMHWITVDPGPEDYWRGSGIPLRPTLSLLDDDRRRRRVSEIYIGVFEPA